MTRRSQNVATEDLAADARAQVARAPRSRIYDGAFFARFIDPVNSDLHAFVANHVEAGAKVLDIGCGTGALAFRLAATAAEVVGVELSPAMIAYAKRRASALGAKNVSFFVGDVSTALTGRRDDSFDVAVMVLVLHEIPADARAVVLREAARVARRVLCIDYCVPLPQSLTGWMFRGFEIGAGPEHFRSFRDFSARGGTAAIAASARLACRRLRVITRNAIEVSEIHRTSAA